MFSSCRSHADGDWTLHPVRRSRRVFGVLFLQSGVGVVGYTSPRYCTTPQEKGKV